MSVQVFFVWLSISILFPFSSRSQGWIDITPEDLHPIHYFNSFDFQDGTFEVLVWNSQRETTKGYRLNSSMQWDSIPAYHSNWCGPGDFEVYQLISTGASYFDSRRFFSIFVRSGCITECITHVYADTTGEVPTEGEVAVFDDFTCAGTGAMVAVSPIDQRTVYLSFFDSLYSSTDGGRTFTGLSSPVPDPYDPRLDYLALSPFDMNIIFIAGFEQLRARNTLYRSTDMGVTWRPVLDEKVNQLEFDPTDHSLIYAATDSGIFRSLDRGSTWDNVLAGGFSSIEADRNSPNLVYAGGSYGGGNGGELYLSTNRGSSWSLYNNTFTTLSLIGIYQLPLNDTLIVVANDHVFKVFASFVLNVEEPQNLPSQFVLLQNYPNPFNPVTTFQFSIKNSELIILRVYNLLGREVATLVNEKLGPGTYTRQ